MRLARLLLALALVVPTLSTQLFAQTLGCVGGGAGGPVPTNGTGGGGEFPAELPPFPGVFPLNVPAVPTGADVLTAVRILGITHTRAGELQFVLKSPSGVSHNLVLLRGGSCDFAGDYEFVPGCSPTPTNSWTCSGLLSQGAYEQSFGLWPDGGNGIVNSSIFSIPAEVGVWTLSVYDWAAGDIGNVNSWELCFGAAPIPSANAPAGALTLTEPHDGSSHFGPTIRLEWFAHICATSYDIEVDGVLVGSASSASFELPSSAGVRTWRVRCRNSAGVGPWSVSQSFTDLGLPPAPCSGSGLTTLFDRDLSIIAGGVLFFDVDVLRPSGILVSELDTNSSSAVGTPLSVEVYLKPGTHVGAVTNASAWTLVSSGVGVSAGLDQPTRFDIGDFQIPFGLHALGVRLLGGAYSCSNANAANQSFSNADLALSLGQSQSAPFVSSFVASRVWNGVLRYDCIPPPSTFCTAGATTNGCSASISVNQQPSVSLASACQIEIASVEGQKQGLVFYGVDNTSFTPLPWGAGSTSYLCVRGPALRAVGMNSGGFAGQCDGALTFDWNAFQSANPGALGAPFAVGDKVYVQGWFRDPPAPRATNLSNAIELTLGP